MAAGDIVQANLVMSLHGQTCMNRFFYVTDAGPGDIVGFATAFKALVSGKLPQICSHELTFTRIDCQRIMPRPTTYVVTAPVNLPGLGVDNAIPVQSTYCVSKVTQYAGRKYRGRWYVPGISVTSVTESQIPAAVITNLQTAWDSFALVMTTAANESWFPILSHGFVPNTDVLHYDKLTKVVVRPVIRNQRRRQVGVGI